MEYLLPYKTRGPSQDHQSQHSMHKKTTSYGLSGKFETLLVIFHSQQTRLWIEEIMTE